MKKRKLRRGDKWMAKKKVKKSKISPRKLVTITNPKSVISEQFRILRANIHFSLHDKDVKKILVTSSIPGEGKSTVAVNLGVVFAQENKRVLIVDADLRKPTLHYTFNLFNAYGLSNFLSKTATINELIQETFIKNLYILPSGPIPPNPSELLASKNMEQFINSIGNYFDVVIFDVPPVLSVSDAQILAGKCDGTLLVVRFGKTERKQSLKAKNILLSSHAKLIGVVCNNYKLEKNNNYYYVDN